jgi:putative ABC transport system ATP-binding protein
MSGAMTAQAFAANGTRPRNAAAIGRRSLNLMNQRQNAARPETGPVISIRRLDFAYHEGALDHQVLFGLDLDIHRGEVVLLTGPSGCGKTTLPSLIGGLRSVESGELVVLGQRLHQCQPQALVQVRRSIGFIFQLHNLLDFLTARQNVQMALQLHPELDRAAMEQRAGEILRSVGLGNLCEAFPAHLSGGQKQRVSIARALASRPDLILADEPTSALDSQTGREVVEILLRLAREEGCTILMVTHDVRIADVADRVIEMEDGRIVR